MWPWVIVRSARVRSMASVGFGTSPARGATSASASLAGSGQPWRAASCARLWRSSRSWRQIAPRATPSSAYSRPSS